MFAVLALGLFVGLQHALEADHLAAVAGLASGSRSKSSVVRHGLAWGFGHFLALGAFAGAVILFGGAINETVAGVLEFAVGAVLVAVGGRVLLRLHRQRVHFHSHTHNHGSVHFHAHSHSGENTDHTRSAHEHQHARNFPLSSLAVGSMHGLAGSAVLVGLSAGAMASLSGALLYVLVFGFASMAGMAALSFVIAIPINYTAKLMTWTNTALQLCIGLLSIGLGFSIVFNVGGMLLSGA